GVHCNGSAPAPTLGATRNPRRACYLERRRREPNPRSSVPFVCSVPALPSSADGGGRGRGRIGWTAHRSAVTANVSIPSVVSPSARRIRIEDVYPAVDGGRFSVKRIAGEPIDVWADIFRDGHARLAADLLWRLEVSDKWTRVRMQQHADDRWHA